jgi:pimeloyl-ACP methyl ester carboxylesterase
VKSTHLPLATGLRYHCLEWDGPEPTTFVLVHGFSDLAATWIEVAERLAPHGHVLAPDLRGHGDSEWIGAGGYYHFMDYVVDLDEVIRQRARQRLVVVGHSMGGSIASYWAGTRANRLAALVLLEGLGPPDLAGADGPTRTAAWIDSWRGARERMKVMPTQGDAVRRLMRHDERLDEPTAKRLAELGTKAVEGGVVWKLDPLHNTMGPYPYRLDTAKRYWERVKCPVACLDGAQSKLNLGDAERAARRAVFADVTHEMVDQAGHALQRHQPARVAEAILAASRRAP